MKKMILGLLAGIVAMPLMAGSITLTPSSAVVNVGELFTVDVIYTFDKGPLELFGFGFDVNNNSLLKYEPTGLSLNPICFPTAAASPMVTAGCYGNNGFGLFGPSATLATLQFRAESAGIGQFGVLGIFDNFDTGIFLFDGTNFLYSSDSLNSTNTVRIVEGEAVPEPSVALLVLTAIPALLLMRRR